MTITNDRAIEELAVIAEEMKSAIDADELAEGIRAFRAVVRHYGLSEDEESEQLEANNVIISDLRRPDFVEVAKAAIKKKNPKFRFDKVEVI
jgi:enoyl-CoA hydratase/carnithine racemase